MSVKERIIDQLKYGSTLFYLAFCLYLYKQGMETTMFPYNYVFVQYSQILIILLLSLKILLYDHCTPKQMIYSIAMVSLALAVARASTHTELVMWVLLVLGARNVPVENILRLYLWITGAIVVVAFAASQMGVIVNLVYKSADEVRNAWGIVYPTDLAAHIFGLVTAWLYLHKGKVHTIAYALLTAGTVVLFVFTHTKLDCSCILLIVFLFGYIQKNEKCYSGVSEKYHVQNSKRKKLTVACIFPAFLAISFITTLLYNDSIGQKLEKFPTLTARFVLGKRGLQTMGVKLFGQAIAMIGAGGGTDARPDYNFIDCSYLNILIQFGPLFLTMILLVLVSVCVKYSRDRYMVAILLCWGLNAVIAHHLVEITYNPYPLLLLAGKSEGEDLCIADILGRVRNKIKSWRSIVNQHPIPSEIQLLQILGLVLIAVSNCLPELIVDGRYDTSRVLWKCLTADGAIVFLLAAGMQLYHEKSYKILWLRTLRTMVLPLWGAGMFSWFFARWFGSTWDFWWSMWHVREDWIGFFKNLLLLKNPFYFMDYTGFLHAYFICILLFLLWKKVIRWIEKKKVYVYILLGVGMLLLLLNDKFSNILGVMDSGWKTVLPVMWLLCFGHMIEKKREMLKQPRKVIIQSQTIVVGLIVAYILLNFGRWNLLCSRDTTDRSWLINGFSALGICNAFILVGLFYLLQKKVRKIGTGAIIQKIESVIVRDGAVFFLLQGMIAAGILSHLQGGLEKILQWQFSGVAGEAIYTGILFGVTFGLGEILCVLQGKISKRL